MRVLSDGSQAAETSRALNACWHGEGFPREKQQEGTNLQMANELGAFCSEKLARCHGWHDPWSVGVERRRGGVSGHTGGGPLYSEGRPVCRANERSSERGAGVARLCGCCDPNVLKYK